MAAARKRELDPAATLSGFERDLAAGPLQRGYLLRGDERWFRGACVDLLRRKGAELGFEVCVHNAERSNADFSRARLTEDLSGGGLFANRRMVILRNPAGELTKAEDGGPSPVTRAMLGFLKAPEDLGTLVLDANSLRIDNPVIKALRAAGGSVLSFRKLYDTPPHWKPDPRSTELVQWFLARARQKGVRLDANQAVYVCAATGNDLAALDDQLGRLSASGGGRIEEIVGWSAAIEPWTVADHLIDGPLPKALGAIEVLFRGGHQDKSGRRTVDASALIIMLVSSLVRGVRQGLALARALEQSAGEDGALRAVGITARGPMRERVLARAKARGADTWARLLAEAVALERQAKGAGVVTADDLVTLALRWQRLAPVRRSAGRGRTR